MNHVRLACDRLRAEALPLATAIFVPSAVASLSLALSPDDCSAPIVAFISAVTLTSMTAGILATSEWRRLDGVYLAVSFVGRSALLIARLIVLVVLGAGAGVAAAAIAYGVSCRDVDGSLAAVALTCAATATACFYSIGYLVGTLGTARSAMLVAATGWCVLFFDPEVLRHASVRPLTAAFPLIGHFWPQGIELGLPIRTEFGARLIVYTLALLSVIWTIAGWYLTRVDLPARPAGILGSALRERPVR